MVQYTYYNYQMEEKYFYVNVSATFCPRPISKKVEFLGCCGTMRKKSLKYGRFA